MTDEIVVLPEKCAVIPQSSAPTDPVVNGPLQAHDMFQKTDAAKKSMIYDDDLSNAISSGNVEGTRELLAKSYDVNCKSKKDGSTPLLTAALNRHEPMIKLLMENGANLGATDNDGNTALHFLSKKNGLPLTKGCIDLLFRYRPPFEAKNRSKITPLMLACENGENELAHRLVDCGACFDACDKWKNTVLHYAAKNTKTLEVVTLLIELGAQVNRKAKKARGSHPLHHVAEYCNDPIAAAIVESLLNAGADREAKHTMFSDTPLLHAVRHQNEACAAQLLKSGVNMEATNTDGWSALHIAVHVGKLSMVNLLLEHGVNPCAKARAIGRTKPKKIWPNLMFLLE